jgi:hypothetical protein
MTILPTMPVLAGTTLGRNVTTGNSSRGRRNSAVVADNAKIAGGRYSVKFLGLTRHLQPAGKIHGGANGSNQTTALVGTMLDTMVDRTPAETPTTRTPPSR